MNYLSGMSLKIITVCQTLYVNLMLYVTGKLRQLTNTIPWPSREWKKRKGMASFNILRKKTIWIEIQRCWPHFRVFMQGESGNGNGGSLWKEEVTWRECSNLLVDRFCIVSWKSQEINNLGAKTTVSPRLSPPGTSLSAKLRSKKRRLLSKAKRSFVKFN